MGYAVCSSFQMESDGDADLTPYLACAKSAKAAYTRSSARTNSSSTKSFAADADSPSGNSLHSSMASKAARAPTTAGNPATPQPMAGSARLGRERSLARAKHRSYVWRSARSPSARGKGLVGPAACNTFRALSECAPVARTVQGSNRCPSGATGESTSHSRASSGPAYSRRIPSTFFLPENPHHPLLLPQTRGLEEVTIPPAANLPLIATAPRQPKRTQSFRGE